MRVKILTLLLASVLLTGCGADKGADALGTMGENMHEQVYDNAMEESERTEDSEAESYVLNFEATTVDGESMTSACFGQSKLTMLNVWATYCGPCLDEMPDLGEIAAAYDTAEFQIIGIVSDVAEDSADEDVTYAKSLIEQTKADYPHLLLNESLYTNLVSATTAVPTTFFVNQKGEVLGYVVGALAKENWEELIDDLLEKEQQGAE